VWFELNLIGLIGLVTSILICIFPDMVCHAKSKHSCIANIYLYIPFRPMDASWVHSCCLWRLTSFSTTWRSFGPLSFSGAFWRGLLMSRAKEVCKKNMLNHSDLPTKMFLYVLNWILFESKFGSTWTVYFQKFKSWNLKLIASHGAKKAWKLTSYKA